MTRRWRNSRAAADSSTAWSRAENSLTTQAAAKTLFHRVAAGVNAGRECSAKCIQVLLMHRRRLLLGLFLCFLVRLFLLPPAANRASSRAGSRSRTRIV